MAWTEEEKQQAIELYGEGNPDPSNSMEIVKEIAVEMNQSPNGVRMILSKAGVYVKKTPAKKSSGSSDTATTRVSKQDSQDELVIAIEATGKTVDMEIISKMTGKAAAYFTGILSS